MAEQRRPATGKDRRQQPGTCGLRVWTGTIAGLLFIATITPGYGQGIPDPSTVITEPFEPPGLSLPPTEPPVAPTPFSPSQSETVVMNLIRLLVQNKVIDEATAQALLAQAQAEAAAGRPVGVVLADPGTVRVPYIPEPVKRQITEDIKQDVLIEARAQSWAAPDSFPEWTSRIKLFGDVRFRFEQVFFGSENFNNFIDVNEINTGDPILVPTPFNTAAVDIPPTFNTTEDRQLFRLRARVGLEAKIADPVTTRIRLATGSDNGPVSTNQTLGSASSRAQGGNFSKYQIWLDQAYLRFKPIDEVTIDVGRAPNPFFRTNLIWDDDVQFDGLSVSGQFEATPQIRPFFTVGGFPVYNTAFNFSSVRLEKEDSRNRYLIGSQIGVDFDVREDLEVGFGIANYFFSNMRGKLGDCELAFQNDDCPTDITRQQFSQKGNTLFALRNISPADQALFGNPQYFGLATGFNILALNLKFDYTKFTPIHVIFDAEYVNNLSFNKNKLASSGGLVLVHNSQTVPVEDADLGSQGFTVQLSVGYPKIDELWDWKFGIGYKYLESDAAVDGFTDSDFHLGGTNAKGFFLRGQLGIADNTWLAARWLSSEEIAGPPLSIDVIQVDLNARF